MRLHNLLVFFSFPFHQHIYNFLQTKSTKWSLKKKEPILIYKIVTHTQHMQISDTFSHHINFPDIFSKI